MIHVFHVIRSLGSGGAERQIVDLVRNLEAPQFTHTVCYFTKPDHFATAIEAAGGNIIYLNLKGKRPWFSAAREIHKQVNKVKPDIIHSWLCDGTISCRLALLSGKPRIVSLCGPDYDPIAIDSAGWSRTKMKVLQWVDRLSGYLFQEEFVACSRYIESTGQRDLGIPSERIRTIYNSVDPNTLKTTASEAEKLRQELKISREALIYTNVGRLDPQKGQTYLIEAFSKVVKEMPNSHLLLIGEGGLEEKLKRQVSRLNLNAQIHFLGVRSDVGTCLAASDVFVFPSLFEGFGMALIEAMFLGLPVIASGVGPIPEIISETKLGCLVPDAKSDALAKEMLKLGRDANLRRTLGIQGQTSALKRFSSQQAIIPQWRQLYSQLTIGSGK